jgi:DNA ligase (NAD+)
MSNIEKMQILVDTLNYHTRLYDAGKQEISDKAWDDMYFELKSLEDEYGIILPDSPTNKIKYQLVNELQKVEHNHKMLSLDKTKDLSEIVEFAAGHCMVAMTKVDGLTCSLRYIDGYLVSAETRGDGVVGEDVLHNALTVSTIPKRIDYTDELVVDGEIVCLYNDFKEFEDEYSNPRNFAAGSIRLLDSSICAKRKLTFIAWSVIKGFDEINLFKTRLDELNKLGFYTVPAVEVEQINEDVVNLIVAIGSEASIPADGVVFKFNDIEYGKAQGSTAHHFKDAIAYKLYDEIYKTHLRNIEWSMGRSGILTPVAIFDPVNIDGAEVSRASLHNLNIMGLMLVNPWRGQEIGVYRANMIIPQIGWADIITKPNDKDILSRPSVCPICGGATTVRADKNTVVLICSNPDCSGMAINKIDHFCSKKGLDIKGLSKATLEKLMDYGWVDNIVDIFKLYRHADEWSKKPGFGEKSVSNILAAIEASKECSLETFIAALGIPLIGRQVAKELVKYFPTYTEFRQAIDEKFDFSELDGFAASKTEALLNFDYSDADEVAKRLSFVVAETNNDNSLEGLKFAVTGTLKQFKNRGELQALIEEHGGKVMTSVTKNVNYLINNDNTSNSSKNVTAKRLGIPIITESEFMEKFN